MSSVRLNGVKELRDGVDALDVEIAKLEDTIDKLQRHIANSLSRREAINKIIEVTKTQGI